LNILQLVTITIGVMENFIFKYVSISIKFDLWA
jgi:hypothetical protein